MAGGQPFDFLTNINDWLESVPLRIITSFNNYIGNGERILQEKVDLICAWLAWKVNLMVEKVRRKVIEALHKIYMSTAVGRVMKLVLMLKRFVQNPLKAIVEFAQEVFAPYASVFAWLKVLLKEIPRLADNLSKIASKLPPDPPNPHINYNAFQKNLEIKMITLGEVVEGVDNMPPPEQMFPEPPKPFTSTSFTKTFNSTAGKLMSRKKRYKLSDKDLKLLDISSDQIA